ncbi:unnamed protein product [Mycena citricolor]|uniref:Carboxypeptidase n=1 Tax=Mycena citricolor TaxID=2018698 RepID=A0AAD2Q5E4_9AGAR|nr:unnamed protein product [Mycena citricolor]
MHPSPDDALTLADIMHDSPPRPSSPTVEALQDHEIAEIRARALQLENEAVGAAREQELLDMILRLTDASRLRPDPAQLVRQAETIATLVHEREYLIQWIGEEKMRWQSEREGWERSSEALIMLRNRRVFIYNPQELQRMCETLQMEKQTLLDHLQSRINALESEVLKLKPNLLMQPFVPTSAVGSDGISQPPSLHALAQSSSYLAALPYPSMGDTVASRKKRMIMRLKRAMNPNRIASSSSLPLPPSDSRTINDIPRRATNGFRNKTRRNQPPLMLASDARAEHLLLAAKRMGRERAGLAVGVLSAERNRAEREKAARDHEAAEREQERLEREQRNQEAGAGYYRERPVSGSGSKGKEKSKQLEPAISSSTMITRRRGPVSEVADLPELKRRKSKNKSSEVTGLTTRADADSVSGKRTRGKPEIGVTPEPPLPDISSQEIWQTGREMGEDAALGDVEVEAAEEMTVGANETLRDMAPATTSPEEHAGDGPLVLILDPLRPTSQGRELALLPLADDEYLDHDADGESDPDIEMPDGCARMLFRALTSLALLCGALAQQTKFHLSSVGHEEFKTLSSARFPNHRVRVKQSAFCDPTVNVYTGYLDVDEGAKHLFFYFFESRRDPAKDDVLMWINGGPGCSSSMGLLMELGPCSIDMSSNGTVWNPHSWNSFANIFFLDQPVGVGFSYAEHGETIETTEDAAKNVHAFISLFFEAFPQFEGRALHLSGESYAGRYLPVFASEIYDQNRQGHSNINLQSVIIGNGITDISTLYPGRYEIECGTAALEVPFQSIGTCVRMKAAVSLISNLTPAPSSLTTYQLPRCQQRMKESCIDRFDAIDCQAAVSFCDSQLSSGMWASGRNVYDISKMCVGDGLCYEENQIITKYLSDPAILSLLGVSPDAANFSSCSNAVGRQFSSHLDKWNFPTQHYVSGLLDRGIRVLIYAGTYDWQCNWVANKLWVDKLEWSGQAQYAALEWTSWGTNGKAGEVKQSPDLPLAFVTVRGESLAMLSAWLHGTML